MDRYDADVVVVGAGPAGATAAYHLAARGHKVILLERTAFPRDKPCGDAITLGGIRLLREMDVLRGLPQVRDVDGLSMSVGLKARSSREFRYGRRGTPEGRYGIVVPRTVLDEAIVSAAVHTGAELRERVHVRGLIRSGGAVRGVEFATAGRTGGRTGTIRARVVVAADGGTSKLARLAGLASRRNPPGHAVRSYFQCAADLTDTLQVFMPLPDPATGARLPSYGWLFPAGGGRVNVGVGVSELRSGLHLGELFARFHDELRGTLPGFADARRLTRLFGAPLNFDFAPERSWAPGLVLVGEAAGLVNQISGEGIGFALESGKIAAQAVSLRLKENRVDDFSGYADTLTRRFSGTLEPGRRAARRDKLSWRVLEDTFDSERPLFALTRSALLAPDHAADPALMGAVTETRASLDGGLRIASHLVEVGEILAETARKDWPFLMRLYSLMSMEHIVAPRPALLVLLAAQFGETERAELTALAAAADLSALAAFAQASVDVTPPGGGRAAGPNWGTMFAVLTADLMLARALQLCAGSNTRLTIELSHAVEQACRGRMVELLPDGRRRPLTASRLLEASLNSGPATLAAASCELGASLANAPTGHVRALGMYGRTLSIAVRLIDDCRRLSGATDHLGRDALADLDDQTPSLPFQLALQHWPPGTADHARTLATDPRPRQTRVAEMVRLVERTDALEETHTCIRRMLGEAETSLALLPDGPARRSLRTLVQRAAHFTERHDQETAYSTARLFDLQIQ